MLYIREKRTGSDGVIWVTDYHLDQWRWLFMLLPQLVAQDMGKTAASMHLQRHSDLGLRNMPLYLCQVPSNFFFPYSTYLVDTWPTGRPYFEIPFQPLDRLAGRYWIDGIAPGRFALTNPSFPQWKLSWIDPEGEFVNEMGYLETVRRARALQTYLLNPIRYVYDESKSISDGFKTSEPTREKFEEEIASFDNTTAYLDWYVGVLNGFFDRYLAYAKSGGADTRERSVVAGLTINRMAVDVILTLSIDVPYVRKWQFFGFLDALAAIINELNETGFLTDSKGVRTEPSITEAILGEQFFRDKLEPTILKIPVPAMRDALLKLTASVYAQIDSLDRGVGLGIPGPKLLRAYRNSRHGYALRTKSREPLLLHDGTVPDNLPDVIVALWHYLLLEYPFSR